MQRDGFKCRDCGSADKTLQVHHCFYEKGDPWNTGDEFLLTLCGECHEGRQEIEDGCRRALARILMAKSSFGVWEFAVQITHESNTSPENCCVLNSDTRELLVSGGAS